MSDRLKGVLMLAAPCGTVGAVLLQQGLRRTGWVFVALAVVVVVLGLLSFLVPGLLQFLRFVSSLVQRLGCRVVELTRLAYRGCLMMLLGPIVHGREGPTALSWTASEKKLYTSAQAADFMVLATDKGRALRGLEFTVRPDYRFQYWRAGFMLARQEEDFGKGHIADTCLFHISMNSSVMQPTAILYVNRGAVAETGLQFYAKEIPAFVVRANIWPTGNTVAKMAVSVDNAGSGPMVTSFDIRFTERVILFAWADGKPFRTHFDDIRAFWAESAQP